METIGAVAGLLSLGVFLWAVVGLINPGWARLPNRWASVKVWFVSVVLFVISGMLYEGGAVLYAIVVLSLGVFLWAVVGLINPAWVNLPDRMFAVSLLFISSGVVFFLAIYMGGDHAPASSESRVPQDSTVAEPAQVDCANWKTRDFSKLQKCLT